MYRMWKSAARQAVRTVAGAVAPKRRELPPSTWRLTRDGSGALCLDGRPLEALLSELGSPLHVVDAARLSEHARRFTARPTGAQRPCEVYYSYKTNPVPGL